ncbi:MAG: NAD-dependent epimerase/dehydratase family protein [Candidatus Ancaeobacter aquaticus]|nr:NAD-dependent epimerase/dehydratase family protein [Candidatus Ancaeobacter aquaticus]
MKVFITGGAGFVGSHVVDRLIGENEIVVYDNLSSGERSFIQKHEGSKNFTFIEGDLIDRPLLEKSIKGSDAVYHFAANPDIRYGIEYTDTDLTQGTIATYNVLEAMRLADVKKIIFSSSSVVYGEPHQFPTSEDYGPMLPISLYGASKLACEGLITSFSHTFGITSWIFRFANIIGKRQTHGLLVDLIAKLDKNKTVLPVLGDGLQEKSYLYIDDCIDGILYAVGHANESMNVYNLSAGDQISVSEIVSIFAKKYTEMTHSQFEISYENKSRGWQGDVVKVKLDAAKINSLGWSARYSSKRAIEKTVEDLLGGA